MQYFADGLASGKTAACPLSCEAVIDRLAIEVNGVTLVNMTNYNALYHALLYLTTTDDYIRSRRVAQTNQLTSGEGAGGDHEVITAAGQGNALIGSAGLDKNASSDRGHCPP